MGFLDDELRSIFRRWNDFEVEERAIRGLPPTGGLHDPDTRARDEQALAAAKKRLKHELGADTYAAFMNWIATGRRRKRSRRAGRRYPTNMAEVYDLLGWGQPPDRYRRPLGPPSEPDAV